MSDNDPKPNPGVSEALSVGTCWRGSDCANGGSDILAKNVTKDDCFRNLGGGSWQANGASRCFEN
ncbi:MAG: hypothetical protein AAGN66_18175 [Acidobacteriota bacterium]